LFSFFLFRFLLETFAMIMFLTFAFALLMFGKPAAFGTNAFPRLCLFFSFHDFRHNFTLAEKKWVYVVFLVNGQMRLFLFGQELSPKREPTFRLHSPFSTFTSHSAILQYIKSPLEKKRRLRLYQREASYKVCHWERHSIPVDFK